MQTPGLFDAVGQALRILRSRQANMFTVQEIAEIIQTELGHQLGPEALTEITRIMHSRWGTGVEPAALGEELWQFGYSKPPVSQEIRGR
jgi:hypothetical protein